MQMLTTVSYSYGRWVAAIYGLCLLDLVLNGIADFPSQAGLPADNAAHAFLAVQFASIVAVFAAFCVLLSHTYLVAIGLIGHALRHFKGVLLAVLVYALVFAAYASCKLGYRHGVVQASQLQLWDQPLFIILSIGQKVSALGYYLAVLEATTRLGQPRWYQRKAWVAELVRMVQMHQHATAAGAAFPPAALPSHYSFQQPPPIAMMMTQMTTTAGGGGSFASPLPPQLPLTTTTTTTTTARGAQFGGVGSSSYPSAYSSSSASGGGAANMAHGEGPLTSSRPPTASTVLSATTTTTNNNNNQFNGGGYMTSGGSGSAGAAGAAGMLRLSGSGAAASGGIHRGGMIAGGGGHRSGYSSGQMGYLPQQGQQQPQLAESARSMPLRSPAQ